jgi:hypothetical protein
MARSVAVSTIMLRARRWANMERDTDFVPDAELIEYVDSAWTRLYKLYAAAWPERFQTEQTIATVVGTATYAVPADWMSTISVDRYLGAEWVDLLPIEEQDRNSFQFQGDPVAFRVIGDNLTLYPTPGAGLTLRHIYLPTAVSITDPAQIIDGILGHERMIELDVAIRLKAKEESDSSQLQSKYDAIEIEVMEEAQMRILRSAQTVGMVNDGWTRRCRSIRGEY